VRQFDALSSDDLTLQLGDEVYITEVNGTESQWCRGWLLAHAALSSAIEVKGDEALRQKAYAGTFPRWCVNIREVLGQAQDKKSPTTENDDQTLQSLLISDQVQSRPTDAPKDAAPLPTLRVGGTTNANSSVEPLIEDIASCITEWHASKLHVLALNNEYEKLEELARLVDRLNDARCQLENDVLTAKELENLRQEVVWIFVKGNKMVGGEVIVRDVRQEGRMLTAQDNLSDLAELQVVMGLRESQIPITIKEPHLSHLLINVKSLPQHLGDPALLHVYLCSAIGNKLKPVSEVFAIELAVDESTGRIEIADDFKRTLFSELNGADIGSGDDSNSKLFLVCKLIRDEPMHLGVPQIQQAPPKASPYQQQAEFDEDSEAVPKSRLSLLGKRHRGISDTNLKPRPSTAGSMTSSSQSNNASTAKLNENGKSEPQVSPKKTRRVAGWATARISSLMRDRKADTLRLSFWTAATHLDPDFADPTPGAEGWDEILRQMIKSPSGRYARVATIGSLQLGLKAFAHDDVDALIREKPAKLRNVHCTPSVRLSGGSNRLRSDVYLTLKAPILPTRANVYHPKQGHVPINSTSDLLNLQVTLEVRTSDGRRIDDAIHPTSNRKPHTAFRSPAIERGEAWNQTIKLSIPADDVPSAHIIVSIADGPGFPFALAWLPLWDQSNGFPPDGQHNLVLWDYCEFTANLIDGRGAYQSLPARVSELQEMGGEMMASLVVETYLSSTTATQNADILALAKVQDATPTNVALLLDRFFVIPDDEIAKFYGPIFASLDGVLDRVSDPQFGTQSQDLCDLVVKCLAYAIRLLKDRRFPRLEGLLDDYCNDRNPSVAGRVAIVRSVRSILSKPFDSKNGRELRAVLKSTDVVLRLALRSGSNAEPMTFESTTLLAKEVSELFEDIVVVFSTTNAIALPTQVIIIQHIHLWLAEASCVCSEVDVVKFASSIAEASAQNHNLRSPLGIQRLCMIINIFSQPQFQSKTFKEAIIFHTESWLQSVWNSIGNDSEEQTHAALRLTNTIIKEQQPHMSYSQAQRYVCHLVNVFHSIHKRLGIRIKSIKKGKAFSPLFQDSYPFRTVTSQVDEIPSEILIEITALLAIFFQPGSPLSQQVPLSNSTAHGQESTITEANLSQILSVISTIQKFEAFPSSWLSLSVSFSKCQIVFLDWILQKLASSLPDLSEDPDGDAMLEFEGSIWQQWFDALISLITSNIISMENHSGQKRRAIWTIGGDVREAAALLLKRAWYTLGWDNDEEEKSRYRIDRMGGYQVQFTATLLPSIVGLGLSLHSGVRIVATDILKTMIIAEWDLSNNLDLVESAFADALDSAFRVDTFELSQAKILIDSLRDGLTYLRNSGAESLHAAVVEMLGETQQLLYLLTDIHATSQDDGPAQLDKRIALLNYLRSTNNEDTYIRHIHDFAEAQVNNKNFASAALAMEMHLTLLVKKSTTATDTSLAKAYVQLHLPRQTIHQRKQMLYSAMVKYFRMGCCWSKVLSTLDDQRNELLTAYDTAALPTILEDQAETYRKLSTGRNLVMPRFFKVTFTETGFPPDVASKSFVFETSPEDDTARFARRLKQSYPNTAVVHSGVTSSNTTIDDPKIYIISVNVNRNQLDPINQRPGVAPFFRHFHLSSNPSTFANSTRQYKPGIPVAEQTVAKTVYVTKDSFPTLLGRSEIIQEEAIVLTPVQAAIDRTHRKTLDVAEILMISSMTDSSETDKLVQAIRSSVDPTSLDSVAAYHELLLEDDPSTISRPTSSLSHHGTTSSARQPTDHSSSPVHRSSLSQSTINLKDPVTMKSSQMRALTIALQDHALMLESALSTYFDFRQSIKSKLRTQFEITFEPELHGLYPDGTWRTDSIAWRDTLPNHSSHPASPSFGLGIGTPGSMFSSSFPPLLNGNSPANGMNGIRASLLIPDSPSTNHDSSRRPSHYRAGSNSDATSIGTNVSRGRQNSSNAVGAARRFLSRSRSRIGRTLSRGSSDDNRARDGFGSGMIGVEGSPGQDHPSDRNSQKGGVLGMVLGNHSFSRSNKVDGHDYH